MDLASINGNTNKHHGRQTPQKSKELIAKYGHIFIKEWHLFNQGPSFWGPPFLGFRWMYPESMEKIVQPTWSYPINCSICSHTLLANEKNMRYMGHRFLKIPVWRCLLEVFTSNSFRENI